MVDYDLCVIGAGSGGVRAARTAAQLGVKVAVVEQGRYGGTCVNVGCVPKKFYVLASSFNQLFTLAQDYGWDAVNPAFSLDALKQAKDTEITRLNGIYQSLLDTAGVTSYNGEARLLGNGCLSIGDQTIRAKKILIATGSRPFVPSNIGHAEFGMVSDEIFDLKKLPSRLAVYGGGYIAIEFACIFRALGVDVDLIYRGDRLLKHFDQETIASACQVFRHHGLKIHLNTTIESVNKKGDNSLQLDLITSGAASQKSVDALLLATGRVANTESLDLDQAGVMVDNQGFIQVKDDYQTSAPGVYALGDVSGGIQLTPMATAEAMDFVRQHYQPASEHRLPRHVATVIFSQPHIATVGVSEEQGRDQYNLAVYKSSFRPLQHSLGTDTNERSFIKILVNTDNDLVVGMHMVGDNAGEIIQGFASAMEAGLTKTQLNRTLGIHPTTAEEFVSLYQANSDN